MKHYLTTNNSEFKRRMGVAMSFVAGTYRCAHEDLKGLPEKLAPLLPAEDKTSFWRSLLSLKKVLTSEQGRTFMKACDFLDSTHAAERNPAQVQKHVVAFLKFFAETKGLTSCLKSVAHHGSRIFLTATWGLEAQACAGDSEAWAIGFPSEKDLLQRLPKSVRLWLKKPTDRKLLLQALVESATEHLFKKSGKKDQKKGWGDIGEDDDAGEAEAASGAASSSDEDDEKRDGASEDGEKPSEEEEEEKSEADKVENIEDDDEVEGDANAKGKRGATKKASTWGAVASQDTKAKKKEPQAPGVAAATTGRKRPATEASKETVGKGAAPDEKKRKGAPPPDAGSAAPKCTQPFHMSEEEVDESEASPPYVAWSRRDAEIFLAIMEKNKAEISNKAIRMKLPELSRVLQTVPAAVLEHHELGNLLQETRRRSLTYLLFAATPEAPRHSVDEASRSHLLATCVRSISRNACRLRQNSAYPLQRIFAISLISALPGLQRLPKEKYLLQIYSTLLKAAVNAINYHQQTGLERLSRPSQLKVRRLVNVTPEGTLLLKSTDVFDEIEPEPQESVGSCIGRLFETLKLPKAALSDYAINHIVWKDETPNLHAIDLETPADGIEEVALIRKGG
jgi:hypothetical protein